MKRLGQWPGLVFALVFGWKLVLFLVSTQSIPADDSFFYDGAVVNYILHGKYVNPALANALPISGTQVYSAYPPLYQASLLPWMSVFGTSIPAQISFHLLLFGLWLVILLGTLRRLSVPAWGCHLAGLFLFVITLTIARTALRTCWGHWLFTDGCAAASAIRPLRWPATVGTG